METNCLEFSNEDFHGALIMMLYPLESKMKENMKQLKTLILDQFSNDVDKFNTWSRSNYEEVMFLSIKNPLVHSLNLDAQ